MGLIRLTTGAQPGVARDRFVDFARAVRARLVGCSACSAAPLLRFTPHYRIKRYRASAAPNAKAAPPYHDARLVAGWPPDLLLRPHHSITKAAPNGLRIKLRPGMAMMGRTRRGNAKARQAPSAPPSRKYPLDATAGWWFLRSRFSLYLENGYSRTSSIKAFPNKSKTISMMNSRSRAFPIQSQSADTFPLQEPDDIHQCPPNVLALSRGLYLSSHLAVGSSAC